MTREEAIQVLNMVEAHGLADEAKRMAIEALSADTVSREQYDHVCEEYNRLVHKAVCIKLCDENCEYEKGKTCYHAREHSAIEALQAEPKTGEWIPCSERLPNEDECGWYLVTVKGHELFVDVVPFNDKLWKGLPSNQEVLAWKPLPMPYREKTR